MSVLGRFCFPVVTEPARKAYKPGHWDRFQFEAINDSITSWINGVPAIDTRDAYRHNGRIGLQLHSAKVPGQQMRFRNIRVLEPDYTADHDRHGRRCSTKMPHAKRRSCDWWREKRRRSFWVCPGSRCDAQLRRCERG